MNSQDKRKSHTYRKYMAVHTCFFVQWRLQPCMKNGFFNSGNGCRCIFKVFLKQKAEELLKIYFIWSSHVECVKHSFVLSIMCVSVRIGSNVRVTVLFFIRNMFHFQGSFSSLSYPKLTNKLSYQQILHLHVRRLTP